MLQSFLVVLGCSPRGLDAKLSSEKHPNGADVLYEHDFRVVSFHRGTELGWKTFLWLSTSHMWEQKHTKVEIKTWQKKKKTKNETKNPHPNQCFWNLREKNNNNNKKKRVFFWFLVKALVGCCLSWVWNVCSQTDFFGPGISRMDWWHQRCHTRLTSATVATGRSRQPRSATVLNLLELFPLGIGSAWKVVRDTQGMWCTTWGRWGCHSKTLCRWLLLAAPPEGVDQLRTHQGAQGSSRSQHNSCASPWLLWQCFKYLDGGCKKLLQHGWEWNGRFSSLSLHVSPRSSSQNWFYQFCCDTSSSSPTLYPTRLQWFWDPPA